LEKAVQEKPSSGLLFEIGIILYDHLSRDDGRQWIEAALLVQSTHREARQTLIKYYDRIGQKRKADFHRQLMEVYPQ
jgi:hypothetical protein